MAFIARVFIIALMLVLLTIFASFHFALPTVGIAPHDHSYIRKSNSKIVGKPSCKIPKIIHQTWKTGQVQAQFAARIKSWIRRNPDWEYRFWTNEDNRNLIATHYPEHLEMYDKYPQNIQRADAVRYFILDKVGGVYADLDFEVRIFRSFPSKLTHLTSICCQALQPFDALISKHDLILGQEPEAHSHILYNIDSMICNAIMASCPGHPFWKSAHAELQFRKDIKTVRATGPKMLTGALERYHKTGEAKMHPVFLPEPEVFYPFFDDGIVGATNLKDKCKGKLSARQEAPCKELKSLHFHNKPLSQHPKSFAVHHWAHTWLGQVFQSQTIDVRKVMEEEKQRVNSCSSDHTKFCPHLVLGDKAVSKCLQEKHEQEGGSALSAECQAGWFPSKSDLKKDITRSHNLAQSSSHNQPLSGVASECDADKRKFCGTVKPGGGRTHKCMQEVFDAGNLSPACAKSEFGTERQKQAAKRR